MEVDSLVHHDNLAESVSNQVDQVCRSAVVRFETRGCGTDRLRIWHLIGRSYGV